jgi:hypothetical protein
MAFDPSLARSIDRIGRLKRTVEKLTELPRAVARAAAPKITRLLQKQFAEGKDPYGRAWRPISAETRRRRKGRKNGPPLTDTRKLRTGTGAKAARFGIRLTLGAGYGYFAQTGTKHAPKRAIFPANGIPAAWTRVLQETARAEFRSAMRAS